MKISSYFTPLKLNGYNMNASNLDLSICAEDILRKRDKFLRGKVNLWGIPFLLGPETGDNLICCKGGNKNSENIKLNFNPLIAPFLVFVHASDTPRQDYSKNFMGEPPLGTKICDYIICYADGSKETVPIRCRYEINNMNVGFGEQAFLSVSHERFSASPTVTDDLEARVIPAAQWGISQTRVNEKNMPLVHWLYAWENPHPGKEITGMEINSDTGTLFLMGITSGDVKANPLRYGRRQKTVLKMAGEPAKKNLQELADIDLGQIVSVVRRPLYDNDKWDTGYNNQQPPLADDEYIVEFCAHEDAILYFGEKQIPVNDLPQAESVTIPEAKQPVTLRVIGPEGDPVAVKVHAHGIGGEYLPPRHRHRIPNPYWFEDYSVDFIHGPHWCTYIDSHAEYLLPQGEVFFEISKGFEIKPIRRRFEITPSTKEIEIKLERVLDWRNRGWVTADTHVHFLSPNSALLEGEAEGVNIVNLLASQWGELVTNIGDFDGKSVLTSGDEYMVRVGTENRQRILGHISLLGYEGNMILPLTTGGPDESALGDPVETTLTQWAAKCRTQLGVNILPHFPNPRGEGAAAIVSELIDGVEMTSWDDLYSGISPYSLFDWYRYLNCGYHVAAVGGTDKMSARTAVGTIRTYALIDGPLTYTAWKDAVKAGRTFATYGALADLRVEGRKPGQKLSLKGPATLQIDWSVASATVPITAVELVIGGETYESKSFDGLLGSYDGSFKAKINGSTWVALRVRGHHKDKPEIITAHTSAVMVIAEGKRPMKESDAMSILEQIEGATAYVKTLGTKAQERQFKEMLAALTAAHRALHNRMHEMGYYHQHTAVDDHHHE